MDHWKQQIKLAENMIVGTVVITVLNIAFLLANSDIYITYCAALPYYLVWLGKVFDNGMYIGAANGVYTATGLVIAGALLAGWVLLWLRARGSKKWLKIGLLAVGVDLALLFAMSVVLFSDPMSCMWEAVIHIAVIWEMNQGLKAWKKIEEDPRFVVEEAAPEKELV